MLRTMLSVALLVSATFSATDNHRYSKPIMLPFGTFQPAQKLRIGSVRLSENGLYRAEINREFDPKADATGHDSEDLKTVTLFKDSRELFTISPKIGSGVALSNKGYAIISGEDPQFNMVITVYNESGHITNQNKFKDPDLFVLSPDGGKYAIGTAKGVTVVSLSNGDSYLLPSAQKCEFSADGKRVILADEKTIRVYEGEKNILTTAHGDFYIRSVRFSPSADKIAFIGQRALTLIDLKSGLAQLNDNLSGDSTYRDIHLSDETLWAGIHHRDRKNRKSSGLLRTYDLQSRSVETTKEAEFLYNPPRKLRYNYGKTREGLKELPWPFEPFDSPQKQWNGYLQLAASRDGTSGTYCHQGLDMDVPSYAKCYSIDSGYVKCNLTIMNPGDLYWRVAVSEVQTPDTSDGWLYAHLEKTTIGVDVGDRVLPGDYIGEIIPWSGLSGGHIHFARIRDHGTSWKYNDGQWWNVYSPLEQLRPLDDNSAPDIVSVFPDSKFGIMTNDADGWSEYLSPDKVSGKVDILVRVHEKAWQSKWIQPAYEIRYWMKNLDKDQISLDTTMGLTRKNTAIAEYSGSLYNNLSTVMYHVTSQFKAKGWFTPNRDYLHIITNVTDSLIASQSDLDAVESKALNTAQFADGNHRLYIEVADAAYNTTIDSMDLVLSNGVSVVENYSTKQALLTHKISEQSLTVRVNDKSCTMVTGELFTMSGRLVESVKASRVLQFKRTPASGMYICIIKFNDRTFHSKVQFP